MITPLEFCDVVHWIFVISRGAAVSSRFLKVEPVGRLFPITSHLPTDCDISSVTALLFSLLSEGSDASCCIIAERGPTECGILFCSCFADRPTTSGKWLHFHCDTSYSSPPGWSSLTDLLLLLRVRTAWALREQTSARIRL